LIIEGMTSDRRNLFWTLVHVGLGFACTLTPFALIVWFYLILFSNFFKANNLLLQRKPIFIVLLFSYLVSFEVLDRMAQTSPFIPYELGKYLLLLMGILGVVNFGFRSQKGTWLVLLMLPSLFYDFSGQRSTFDIINYFIGPFSVALIIGYSDKLPITTDQLNQVIKLVFWASLASLSYTVIRTPDFEDISFKLGANFDTTGGHSSNQVSTVLGLGMFLSFYSIYGKLNFAGNRFLDVVILAGFTFQGLLSFSRGGMMVGAFCIILLLFLPQFVSEIKKRKQKSPLIIAVIVIVVLYGVFEVVNSITGGNLLLRYQGETQGTLLTSKEVTLDHYVTGRLGIFEADIDIWLDHPLTGVGTGASKYFRVRATGETVASHVELSRFFADQGILGLIYAIIFFIDLPLKNLKQSLKNERNLLSFILIVMAIATTFHAAMRTFVTPLFIALSVLRVVPAQKVANKT
jgi:hypothetical protein